MLVEVAVVISQSKDYDQAYLEQVFTRLRRRVCEREQISSPGVSFVFQFGCPVFAQLTRVQQIHGINFSKVDSISSLDFDYFITDQAGTYKKLKRRGLKTFLL
jgi:hypothetical protein